MPDDPHSVVTGTGDTPKTIRAHLVRVRSCRQPRDWQYRCDYDQFHATVRLVHSGAEHRARVPGRTLRSAVLFRARIRHDTGWEVASSISWHAELARCGYRGRESDDKR